MSYIDHLGCPILGLVPHVEEMLAVPHMGQAILVTAVLDKIRDHDHGRDLFQKIPFPELFHDLWTRLSDTRIYMHSVHLFPIRNKVSNYCFTLKFLAKMA